MSSPARGRLGKRIAIALVALLGPLVLAEIVLRIWAPFPRDFPWYPDDHVGEPDLKESTVVDAAVGWRFAPDVAIDDPSPDFHVTYHCNADGFRIAPAAPAAPRATLVFVGDSFTFGIGVEEGQTFADRVAAARPDVRVVNDGMAGYGVDQMWRALVEFGLREKPSVAIATFVDDDLTRCLTSFRLRSTWAAKPAFVLDGERLVPRTVANSPGAFVRFVEREPYLAEVWRRAENKLGLSYGFGRRFELNRALFAALHDDCAKAKCALVVVHLPQRGAWRPAPAFGPALERIGALYLDLGTLHVDDPRALFFAHDPHIDADGHRFVAEQLTRFLVEHRLLEPLPR